MRVISVNVNGIRSAANKGFFTWLEQQNADVVCLQEVRANEEQLTDKIFNPHGYKRYFFCATQKGYSGVAIYSKREPDNLRTGLGWDIADDEGRYIEAQFGDLNIASVYLPSGTSGDARQAVKYTFLDNYLEVLKQQIANKKQYILCGDWNIAHKNLDLKNWRSNQDNSGFLPQERAWLDVLFDQVGFVDAYRKVNPEKEQYTWWSNRGQAWANNTGWRIDYHIVTPGLVDKITHTHVYREQKFSDHAPLIIDYAI
ncbi:MAG TPA: exodeoxyribonuclease III [Gammaproteobacteria bacterium]|nr:exodeoxyribonuclease III [Gammaproteobacteria bacterium]